MRFFKSGRYIAYINTKLLRERGSLEPAEGATSPETLRQKGL